MKSNLTIFYNSYALTFRLYNSRDFNHFIDSNSWIGIQTACMHGC